MARWYPRYKRRRGGHGQFLGRWHPSWSKMHRAGQFGMKYRYKRANLRSGGFTGIEKKFTDISRPETAIATAMAGAVILAITGGVEVVE